MSPEELDGLTRCFAARVAAWFAHEGTVAVEASSEATAAARQANMALALVLSRWVEFAATERDAVARMREWLDATEARAVARGAAPRAEAVARARAWLEGCLGGG